MSLSGVVPQASTYKDGGLPLALESKRREVKVLPQQGSEAYSPDGNQIIRIDLSPSLQFLDVANSYLCFELSVENVDADKVCRFDKSAGSFIRRLEIIGSGGQVLESIDDYNLLVNVLHAATSPDDYKTSAGKMIDNQANDCERNGFMANAKGRTFCCGFDASGILGTCQRYLPLQFMNGSMTIEIQLAPFNDCFIGFKSRRNGAGDPKYVLKNVYYNAACVSFGQDYNQIFESKLRESGVSIHFHTYRTHHHTLTSTSDTTFQISQAAKSVKGCYTIIRDKKKYRSPHFDSLSTYKSGGLVSYQFDLGGDLQPLHVQQVKDGGSSRAYCSMLNSFNNFRDHSSGSEISAGNYNASQTDGVARAGDTTYVAAWKGNVVKRINGTMFCGKTDGQTTAPSGILAGYFFIPDDFRDLAFWNVGDRIKINLFNVGDTGATASSLDDATASGKGTKLRAILGSAVKQTGTNTTYVDEEKFGYVTGVGLRSFISDQTGTIDGYGEFPCISISLAKESIGAKGRYLVRDIEGSSNFVGGTASNLKLKKNALAQTEALFRPAAGSSDAATTLDCGVSAALDLIPDDSRFFIAQTFETHHESEKLISGADQSAGVSLHLNLKFESNNAAHPNDSVNNGDMMSSFIHYDSILHIDQIGEVSASQ